MDRAVEAQGARDAAELRWLKAMEMWENEDRPKRWRRGPGYLIGVTGMAGFIGADFTGRLGDGGWVVPLIMVAGAAAMVAANMPVDKPYDPTGGRLAAEWFRHGCRAIFEREERMARTHHHHRTLTPPR